MAIDTLQLSKDLQDVEFTRDQADVLARIFLEHTNGRFQGNLERLDRRMEMLENRLEMLENRMEMLEASLQKLQESMNRGFEDLRASLKAEIKAGDASTKVDLTKWIVGALVLNLAGTAGLIITLIRTIAH